MTNLRVYCPLVNGQLHEIECDSGQALIHDLLTDDWGPKPYSLVFEARTEDGRLVRIAIPYDAASPARAVIKEDE